MDKVLWKGLILLLQNYEDVVFFRNNAAERRRLVIQESKFLGGDMEHTHLVKGLDFALLQKVRHLKNDGLTSVEEFSSNRLV